MTYKKFGTITNIGEPNVERKLQEFILEEIINGKPYYFPFTMFEQALTDENTNKVWMGNQVTVTFVINSREVTSQSGTNYYRLGLSVFKIEDGNTTGEEASSKTTTDNKGVVFAKTLGQAQTQTLGNDGVIF